MPFWKVPRVLKNTASLVFLLRSFWKTRPKKPPCAKNPYVQKNYEPGPFDWSKFHSNRIHYRWEINVLIFFKFWRESESGPATPSREGRPILHYHLMIVEGPRNHHTTFWPKEKSCQLAFNLTFFYPIVIGSSGGRWRSGTLTRLQCRRLWVWIPPGT